MSKEKTNQDIAVWRDQGKLNEIKKIYGKGLTDGEWGVLVGIGEATGLNPFLREIWAVKYGNQAASIFVGRDGYRKTAQRDPRYDYHIVDAVYSKDEFSIEDCKVQHKYKVADRGLLAGAYCIIHRKKASKPIYHYVDIEEYYAGNQKSWTDKTVKRKKGKQGEWYDAKPNLWDSKPATMIKKVAEAQGLRMAFQELFAGTYDESEQWKEDAIDTDASPAPGEYSSNPDQKPATPEQRASIELQNDIRAKWAMLHPLTPKYKAMPEQRALSFLLDQMVKKKKLSELSMSQAEDLLAKLSERLELILSKNDKVIDIDPETGEVALDDKALIYACDSYLKDLFKQLPPSHKMSDDGKKLLSEDQYAVKWLQENVNVMTSEGDRFSKLTISQLQEAQSQLQSQMANLIFTN